MIDCTDATKEHKCARCADLEMTISDLEEAIDIATRTVDQYRSLYESTQQILRLRTDEVEKLRATLAFYADPANYDHVGSPYVISGDSPDSVRFIRDFGEKAREALQELGDSPKS